MARSEISGPIPLRPVEISYWFLPAISAVSSTLTKLSPRDKGKLNSSNPKEFLHPATQPYSLHVQ